MQHCQRQELEDQVCQSERKRGKIFKLPWRVRKIITPTSDAETNSFLRASQEVPTSENTWVLVNKGIPGGAHPRT